MALSLRVCDVDTSFDPPRYVEATDEELIELGGRWDRREKRWAGETELVHIVRVPRGSDQEQPARWLAEWFRRFAISGKPGDHWTAPATLTGREAAVEFRRAWTLMLVGGRRGGKSHLAVFALVAMALLLPRSTTWAISPTQDETAELDTAARSMLPLSWFVERTGKTNKTLEFRFMNGSALTFRSGHKPRGLKRGRVDLALYNEGQNMTRAGWRQLRGAITDIGGLVVIACNPPDEEIGRWIEDLYTQIRARNPRVKAEAFHLVAKHNPFVTEQALEDMRAEVDDVSARKEVDGEMGVPIGDVVFHAWSDIETIRDVPPAFVDVTAEVTRRELGRAAGYVVGMDFQKTPHMVAAIYKLFRDPAVPDEVLAWLVDEVLVPDSNEYELCDALEALERWTPAGRVKGEGYRGWVEAGDSATEPVHCCVIADASGWYQDGAHQKGAKSDRMLAERKWSFAYRPQKDSNDNPRVKERVKVMNARLKAGKPARRRLFSLAHNLQINKALRDWKNHDVTGMPNKNSDNAHACDAASYPIYRLFGAVKRTSGGGYKSGGKYSSPDEVGAFGAEGESMIERSRRADRRGGRDEW